MDDYSKEQTPPLLYRQQTSKLAKLANCVRIAWTWLQGITPPARYALGLTLLALVTFCAGCATQLPPSEKPRLPAMPPISEPIPGESYSSKVQKLLEGWLKRVTDMQPM